MKRFLTIISILIAFIALSIGRVYVASEHFETDTPRTIVVRNLRIAGTSTSQPSTNRKYKIFLEEDAYTSAAVYTSDSVLIRHLFDNEYLTAGDHIFEWDGYLDDSTVYSGSGYNIKYLTSNITTEWEGAYIGNSSLYGSGSTRFRIFDFEGPQAICVYDTNVFVASGYAEGWPAEFRMSTNSENRKTWVGKTGITALNSQFVATDGTIVYWAGFDPYENTKSLVWGSNYTNNAQIAFSSGVDAHMDQDNSSAVTYKAISYKNQSNSVITGLAVQQSHSFLFVARSGQNELQVLNKSTGALAQTKTISAVTYLGVDNSDNLWAAHGSTITQYSVNSSTGDITATGVTVTGITNIGGFGFSPDGTTITVSDVTNQVVKGFSTTTGSLSWTLGTSGGYLTNSTVTNSKFYFKDVRSDKHTSIAYLPDGSFYVNDPGNYRFQKYEADRDFSKSIMMNAGNYRVFVDKAYPTRVFADYMEFEIDYDADLSATTGWSLKRNWGANITDTYFSTYRMQNIVTFPNGRTYARLMINGVTYELVELVNNGVVRYTGVMLGQYGFLNLDGSKMVVESNSIYKKYALTGYDGSNNPTWSASATTLSNPTFNSSIDPRIYANNYETPITETGKLIYFNCARVDNSIGNEFHLGAVNLSGTNFLWKSARGTQRTYDGEFPQDGAFDNGNGVQSDNRAGGSFSTYKRYVLYNYKGEFWKQSQTNKWNLYDTYTGLLVTQFGELKSDYPGAEAPAGVAGNVMGGTLVEVNGQLYLYHNDEGINNGVQRWKINGLNTVKVSQAVLSPSEDAESDGINLLAGFTRASTILNNNTFGWTRNPVNNATGNTITLGGLSYNKKKEPDIAFYFNKPTGNSMTAQSDLGTNAALTSWRIKGKVNYQYNNMSEFNLSAASFLDVVDATGKQIARFDYRQDANQSGTYGFRGNDVWLTGGSTPKNVAKSRNEPFEISLSGGVITFKYAGYTATTSNVAETGAVNGNPKYFRFYAYTSGFQTVKYVSIAEMYFKANSDL